MRRNAVKTSYNPVQDQFDCRGHRRLAGDGVGKGVGEWSADAEPRAGPAGFRLPWADPSRVLRRSGDWPADLLELRLRSPA